MDKLTDQENREDHDRGIRLETKISIICDTLNKLDTKFDKTFNEVFLLMKEQRLLCDQKFEEDKKDCVSCRKDIQDSMEKKVPWGKFQWFFGGVATLVMASFIWLATLALNNQADIKSLTYTIEDHIEHAEDFYKRFPEVKLKIEEETDPN